MRTTLTLDPDVAVLVEQARESTKKSLKEVVNEAIRRGMSEMEEPPAAREQYTTPPVSLGGCLFPEVDDVAGILALVDEDQFQ